MVVIFLFASLQKDIHLLLDQHHHNLHCEVTDSDSEKHYHGEAYLIKNCFACLCSFLDFRSVDESQLSFLKVEQFFQNKFNYQSTYISSCISVTYLRGPPSKYLV